MMHRSEHAVVIAGGGPTGLTLAGELALAGVEVVVIERRQSHELVGARAGGLQARSIEMFDQRGIAERFLQEGQKAQTTGFAGVRFDISGFPTRHPYGLGLWQTHIERILTGWVEEMGVPIHRGIDVSGLSQDDGGVEVALSDGGTMRTRYLVGCDGGRSVVRKAAGIAFPGTAPTTSNLIAEVEMTAMPEFGVHRSPLGIHSFGRRDYSIVDGKIVYADHGPIGVMVTEQNAETASEPTLDDLRQALIAACGTDYGVHSPLWISRFTDAARQAATYRRGRVLVAGDAAHIHPPDGGQGLNTGVQDAMNLGWKLAQVVKGVSPDMLLDSYHDERHPVAAQVLRLTLASVTMRADDDRSKAVRETMAELLAMGEPRRTMAATMSGLAIRYEMGGVHPLVGRRMPDLELATAEGPRRVYELLHEARPLLISLGTAVDRGAWASRVRVVEAAYGRPWELPAIGAVDAPGAVLVRPDGYVAWVGEGSDSGLVETMERWFGPA
jgi:2-polyprenyl-6-methoxyphenol hydroxylase-like FAD-dependent oxidoreductase